MKKWNWTMGTIVFIICVLGSMANINYDNMLIGFVVGLIFGVVFGLFNAWFFK